MVLFLFGKQLKQMTYISMPKIDRHTKPPLPFLLVPTSLPIVSVQQKICNNKQACGEAHNYESFVM